jgi:hypothetical protein
MKKKSVKKTALESDFESLVLSIVRIHQQAQEFAVRAVNVGLTLRNWFIGHRIVEFEQNGADRAGYGEKLMATLSQRLAAHGLPQVTPRELRRYRQLYQVYPWIWQSVTAKSLEASGFTAMLPFVHLLPSSIRESVTAESQNRETVYPELIHRLSFTHLTDLPNKLFVSRYSVEMPKKREMEAFLKQLGKEFGHAH